MFTAICGEFRVAETRDISVMMTPAASASKRYWVVGGIYDDTSFEHLSEAAREERYGPFATFAAAKEEWARLAWRTVDDCHSRYRVTLETDAAG